MAPMSTPAEDYRRKVWADERASGLRVYTGAEMLNMEIPERERLATWRLLENPHV